MAELMTPKVSVIVPTYNRSGLLAASLATLVEQTVPPLEIIVVDDGSRDDTEAVVAALPGPIRYVRKENGGKSAAVNLGLSLAKGDFIWFFDDDDWAEPDAIAQRWQVLQARPELDFVGAGHYMGHADEAGRKVVTSRRHMPAHAADVIHLRLFEDCYFSLCSVLARRRCYEQVGGFDVTLKSSEDYDVLLRLASHFRFDVIDVPVFTVRQHDGVRGAGEAAYQAHQRREVFRRTDRVIGGKLRQALPLSGFLSSSPAETAAIALSPAQRVDALLSRAVVMASKGMIDDMFDDLRSAAQDGQEALTPAQCQRAQQALMCDYAFDAVRDMGVPAFRAHWLALRHCGARGQALAAALRLAVWRLARMRTAMPWSERLSKLRVWWAVMG